MHYKNILKFIWQFARFLTKKKNAEMFFQKWFIEWDWNFDDIDNLDKIEIEPIWNEDLSLQTIYKIISVVPFVLNDNAK